MLRSSSLLLSISLLLAAIPARASSIPCAPVAKGGIQIDGLLGDWRGVKKLEVNSGSAVIQGRGEWSGPKDLSFSVSCNHDDRHLYLAVRVTDEYFVRNARPKGDDHVLLKFRGRTLVIHPGDLRTVKLRVRWGRRGPAKGVTVAEAMQTDGYSVEVRLPLSRVPGYRKGMPWLALAVTVADSDSKAARKVQSRISSGRSKLIFAQEQANLTSFLRDKGYRSRQIRWRKNVDVVGDRRLEQVVFVGRTLGIVGHDLPRGGYFYLDLPVRSPSDMKWIRAMDLNGDRKAELLMRFVERSSGGFRELLAVYRFDSSNAFVRPILQEVSKGQGSRLIKNRVTLKRRRRRRKSPGGVDIIIDQPQARGFTQETFRERPASDAYPILLPWAEKKRRSFRFDGDEFAEM